MTYTKFLAAMRLALRSGVLPSHTVPTEKRMTYYDCAMRAGKMSANDARWLEGMTPL